MKKTVTTLSSLANKVAGRLLLSALFLLFSIATIFSQGVESRLEIGDYSKVDWKSQSEIAASISQKNTRMDVALTQTDLQIGPFTRHTSVCCPTRRV